MQSLSSSAQQNVKIATVDTAGLWKKAGKAEGKDYFADVFANIGMEKPAQTRPAHEEEKPRALTAEAPLHKPQAKQTKKEKAADKAAEKADIRDDNISAARRADKADHDKKADEAEGTQNTDDQADEQQSATATKTDSDTVKKDPVKIKTVAGSSGDQKAETDDDNKDGTQAADPSAEEVSMAQPPEEQAQKKVETPLVNPFLQNTQALKKPEAETASEDTSATQEKVAPAHAAAVPAVPQAGDGKAAGDTTEKAGEKTSEKTKVATPPVKADGHTPEQAAAKDKPDDAKKQAYVDESAGEDKTYDDHRSDSIKTAVQDNKLRNEAGREYALDKKAARHEAQKVANQIETLSHPAAGSRANTEATQSVVTGSHAPAPNGSSGGGSPTSHVIQGVTATTAAATHGVEATHATSHTEQTSFANLVKSAKESAIATPAQQIAVHVSRGVKDGANRFEIELHPADLGKVDIRLDISKEGLVRAVLTADNQSTLDLLQRDKNALTQTLEKAGLETDSGSLSFNLRGQESRDQQDNIFARNRGAAKWFGQSADHENAVTETIYYRPVGEGRIDLRV